MEILKFSTNIDSEASMASIAQLLDQETSIHQWRLDTQHPEHILSVSGNEPDPQTIKNILKKAGYAAEVVRVKGISGRGL